mgnify:CR=1 FL=1
MISHKTLAVFSCAVLVLIIGVNMFAQRDTAVPVDDKKEPVEVEGTEKDSKDVKGAEEAGDVKNTTETVRLSEKKLTEVPQHVLSNTRLEVLDLSHNNLEGALPAEIRHLSKLQILDISHNNFTGVPAEVGQLSNLIELNLSYNNLTGLPHEIGNLHKLEVLDVRGNEYSEFDMEIIRKSLPSTTKILTD